MRLTVSTLNFSSLVLCPRRGRQVRLGDLCASGTCLVKSPCLVRSSVHCSCILPTYHLLRSHLYQQTQTNTGSGKEMAVASPGVVSPDGYAVPAFEMAVAAPGVVCPLIAALPLQVRCQWRPLVLCPDCCALPAGGPSCSRSSAAHAFLPSSVPGLS